MGLWTQDHITSDGFRRARRMTIIAALLAGTIGAAAIPANAAPITIREQHAAGRCVEIIFGTKGDDNLDGSASHCDQTIMASAGNDILVGGRGRNVLIGGKGQDTMTGGAKNHHTTFVFGGYRSSTPDAPDIITDFVDSGPFIDRIALGGICKEAGIVCTFIGSGGFSGTAGQVRYEVMEKNGATVTELSADTGGTGTADFAIDLLGSHTLTTENVHFE